MEKENNGKREQELKRIADEIFLQLLNVGVSMIAVRDTSKKIKNGLYKRTNAGVAAETLHPSRTFSAHNTVSD